MKKAHELALMCGLKISIFCTDFDSNCFTFCNDARLRMDPGEIFREMEKPINITHFGSNDVRLTLIVEVPV